MSDSSQGAGWWRASNGKWYPPEAKPGARKTPPGVPQTTPPNPKVQQPFTPRRDQTLEHDREKERRRQERRPTRDRRKVPWGWIGIGVLVLIFGGVGTYLAVTAGDEGGDAEASTETEAPTTDTTDDSEDTVVTVSDEVSVFDLEVGDCFTAASSDGDDGPLVTTAEIADCDDPHLAEVILVDEIDTADGVEFPGIDARDEAAEDLCQPAFETYVGIPLAASELGLLWLAPTEQSWTDQDDREVTCAVQALDGDPLIGSVEGSER